MRSVNVSHGANAHHMRRHPCSSGVSKYQVPAIPSHRQNGGLFVSACQCHLAIIGICDARGQVKRSSSAGTCCRLAFNRPARQINGVAIRIKTAENVWAEGGPPTNIKIASSGLVTHPRRVEGCPICCFIPPSPPVSPAKIVFRPALVRLDACRRWSVEASKASAELAEGGGGGGGAGGGTAKAGISIGS